MRWLGILAIAACSNEPAPASPASNPVDPSASVASPESPPPTPIPIDAAAPTAPADDHAASAAAIYDATNYVMPAELAYSRKLGAVIYPACGGGEGPGEHCGLAAYDKAGKDLPLANDVRVLWQTHPGPKGKAGRRNTVDQLAAAFDKLDTIRLDRRAWAGAAPIDLSGFGRIDWKPKDKVLVATRDGRTTRTSVAWGEKGGVVNAFWSPEVPLAVVQLRFNPASGGKEGYVVFIQLVVVPRP